MGCYEKLKMICRALRPCFTPSKLYVSLNTNVLDTVQTFY
jgi:hypothetical protein